MPQIVHNTLGTPYRVTKTLLKEGGSRSPYVMNLVDIIPGTFAPYKIQFSDGIPGRCHTSVTTGRNALVIGCQKFRGENAKTILKAARAARAGRPFTKSQKRKVKALVTAA